MCDTSDNCGLTENGIEITKKQAEELDAYDFDIALYGPIARVINTKKIIMARHQKFEAVRLQFLHGIDNTGWEYKTFYDLEHDETFQLSLRAARRFAEVGGELTLFGLPTIASTLNIAINLYGQEILMAMLEEPEAARADLETINRTLVRIHKAFMEILPPRQLQPVISWARTQPPGYGQICGCSTQLLSGELYREMIADLDEDVLRAYPNGGMIHLCGSHAQHIETFRNMKALRAVQVNDRAAEDLQLYFDGLREDQVLYLNPCAGMTVERAMEITGGRRLVICAHLDRPVKR
jgi:hypothetical protein